MGTLRRSPATRVLVMKLVVLLSLAVFACASSMEKRDADPEPGYGHRPVSYVAPSYHHPSPHSYKYVAKYTPKYPVYGYGYGIHHHHKRSADPEPEASADPEPEASSAYGKPSYYGHHGYVSPVYPSYGYHPAPAYKSYSPYPTYGYRSHHHHKRSADPQPEASADPEPEASSAYGKPSYYSHSYVSPC